MSKLDEIHSAYSKDLDSQVKVHQDQTNAELQKLAESLGKLAIPALPPDIQRRLEENEIRSQAFRTQNPPTKALPRPQPAAETVPAYAQVNIHHAPELRVLDREFARRFFLADYRFPDRLNYPTVYCETLEEFFTPLLADLDISEYNRQELLKSAIDNAKSDASQNKTGILGVNLPGTGCYINGWLFGFINKMTPREAFANGSVRTRILQTTAHEKLGHGFLTEYTALGQMNKNLGLEKIRLAQDFGIRAADTPLSSLRAIQSQIVFHSSKLLEEGWSEWIEDWLPTAVLDEELQPPLRLDLVFNTLQAVKTDNGEFQQILDGLLAALACLFTGEEVPPQVIFQAVQWINQLDRELANLFEQILPLPLRYIVGKRLFFQAEQNLGAVCLPYMAMIAGNVSYDLDKIAATDLASLLERDLRLHPDARLAILSRIALEQPNSVAELVRRAHLQLNFSVPDELKSLI